MSTESQNESGLPLSNKEKRSSSNLLPRIYRTDSNKKFFQATLDQLIQPGSVKKVNGFIGRQDSKSTTASDIFLQASDKSRQDYQLESSVIIQDYLGNTSFFKDYNDYINQLSIFGSNVENHERLTRQELYSWNPHICWDKFVNYRNYYWLPYGPEVITVFGQQKEVESTYTVQLVPEGDNNAYLFSPNGLTRNPTLTLYRGQTYNFNIISPNNPFSFKSLRSSGELDRYTEGVTQNSVTNGNITFTVPVDAPDVLFYVSEVDINVGGLIKVYDIIDNSYLDIDNDILGKKEYITSFGLPLSNGMKLKFVGNVTPTKYSDGYWYVEGVGNAITLVSEKNLEILGKYSTDNSVLFDNESFDQTTFSGTSGASLSVKDKDYIVSNRASLDRNAWTRHNKWFHQDVIVKSAELAGVAVSLDQQQRAARPIIEFNAGLQLFNFGTFSKDNVDLIDNVTTDVFSTIEGSLGYNIDGVDLEEGMRVLFTNDPDVYVKNKIFQVTYVNVTIPGRQIEFSPTTNILLNNIVRFTSSHGLTTGQQLTYLNNGNSNVSGLENRNVYYVEVLNDTDIKLYTNSSFVAPVQISASSSGIHKFEIYLGFRKQINLQTTVDSDPVVGQTLLIYRGVINQGVTYWYNGEKWKISQEKLSINQPPLFDVFDQNGHSFSDNNIYEGTDFKGTKLFSYKLGSGTADTELGFPIAYKNIDNVGDISFNFNLLIDSFSYKVDVNILTKKLESGYLKISNRLGQLTYANGWIKTDIDNIQPIVRIFKESGLTNNFPIDVYNDKDQLSDLKVKVFVNGKRLNKEQFGIIDNGLHKIIKLVNDVSTTDIVTLNCFSKQSKNENGHYKIPVNLQHNPLNENVTEFTLGQVADHVDNIVSNLDNFIGTFPGSGNLRDLGNLSQYGTKFVQHSGPLNLSLYHLANKEINIVKAIEQARDDYGKFKRAFILEASNSGIDANVKQHVDYILTNLSKDKTKTSPYYFSDMFAFTGYSRLEIIVEYPENKIYPMSENFNLSSLSSRSVNIYLNDEQLLHGRDYVFGENSFFEILIPLAENDVIEVYEYQSTDGSFCPPTPTKLGLYPLFEPLKFVDDTYQTPTEVIQGHDGSIVVAFGDYLDDLILELERRIFNNIKSSYNTEFFDIYDYIPGYSRNNDYTKVEFEKILAPYFYQWSGLINQDYTSMTDFDRFNPFTFNYRGNYAPDGSDIPAFWRGIYRWMFDTDRPHTHPWEMLGFTLKPSWWETVYGTAPYTSDNLILWKDLENGVIRQPGVPVKVNSKFARPVLSLGLPVDKEGYLVDPLMSNLATGIIKATDEGYFEFGDVAPVESAWRRSSYYPFALIQTILLMAPNRVMGICLDRSRIVKNLVDQYIYKDTGVRLKLKDIVLPSTSHDNERILTSGLVNYLIDYITSDNTFVIKQYKNDLQNLTNKLASKLGGFTSKNKFKLILDSKQPTSSGGVFVPEENYKIILNTSSPIKKINYSGVIITKFDDGFEIKGYNVDDPYFNYLSWTRTDRVIKVGEISEGFVNWESGKFYTAGKLVRANNQYYRVKTTHTSGDTFDENNFVRLAELPTTGGREAMIRDGWNTREIYTLGYSTKLSTIQEVADFLQGYGAYLNTQGFVFDDFNINTSLVSNWETSLKEFLFWTTQNWAVGSVLSLSPAAEKITLRLNTAVVNNIRDPFYGYKIFKVDGQKLEPEFTNTYRDDGIFTLQPVNTEQGIFGATFYFVQKEHVLILDNESLFNDIIYDIKTGYQQERIKVVGYVSSNWSGGFNIPGFIFDEATIKDWEPWTDYNLGDIVKYKEFYYSAKQFLPGVEKFETTNWVLQEDKPVPALLPNWDYKALQFTDFYDLDTDNFDSEQQRLAQHLIGYQKRQYLENIIKDDVSQYKFYQGMIIEKGTKNVLNKLFDVLSSANYESLTFNEEWAVRVGNFGATSAFDEIEYQLDESRFKLNPQPFELVNTIDATLFDFVYRQTPSDIYIKPTGYNNNPWPTIKNKKPFLRTPGYVKYEDVFLSIDSIDDILNYKISDLTVGDYIWCAFEGISWNVYRFTPTNFKIINVLYDNNNKILTLVCNKIPELQKGDIVGIENSTAIQGFYKIDRIENNQIIINTSVKNWKDPFEDQDKILTYKFTKSRVDNIDNANSIIPRRIKDKELIWIDEYQNGKSAVLKNNKVFNKTKIDYNLATSNLNFGKKVSVSRNGLTAAITDNQQVQIFKRSTLLSSWTQDSYISKQTGVATESGQDFGTETCFSPDGTWLVISAPLASNVKVIGENVSSSGTSTGLSNHGYVNFYKKSTGIGYRLIRSIVSPTPTSGEKFGSKVRIIKSGDSYTVAISSTGYNSSTGRVYFYKLSGSDLLPYASPIGAQAVFGEAFGSDLSFSDNGDILAVSSPAYDQESGKVSVYLNRAGQYVLVDTLDRTSLGYAVGSQFGKSISVSASGDFLAVGSILEDSITFDQGKVYVFALDSGIYNLHQEIYSSSPEDNERFGSYVSFSDDSKSLIIFSAHGDTEKFVTFDNKETKFDSNSLSFVDLTVDSGRVDVYDRYNSKFIFGESLDISLGSSAIDRYGFSLAVGENTILAGAPSESTTSLGRGDVYAYTRAAGSRSWSIHYQEYDKPDVTKIKKSFLYNRTTQNIEKYLDVVDPIYGKIPGIADQEIKFKTFYDPATYSIGTSSLNVDDGLNWSKQYVGMLWWDLTRAKFLNSYSGDVVYRSTSWNKLFKTASIDVYEWVESSLTPDEWDELADTEEGLTQNISGKSKYGNNAYSIVKKYDSVSGKFSNLYYFWVKNKLTIPNIESRKMSANAVSALIADPIGYGYPCIALTGTNSFNLVNVDSYVNSNETILNVQYWLIDNQDINTHSQWKIISEHPNTILPVTIEEKWIDSLVGKDKQDRPLPDLSLPVKHRYGIQNRPRQSMFVNRFEALKQFIERVNAVLVNKLIVDDYDISDLLQFDVSPSLVSGLWDITLDSNAELRFIGTAKLIQAQISPIVENGRVTGATIINAGAGYQNAPKLRIFGLGSGAEIKSVINSAGEIVEVIVENPGRDYVQETTTVSIRPFSVLIKNDATAFNKWAIYAWDKNSNSWARSKLQSYDVTKFWRYVDWYAKGYTQYTIINYIVDNTYQLTLLDDEVGDIVKVNYVGSGGWMLLEKYNNKVTVDYTENYRVIARQSGTIEFLDNLYTFNNAGFSGPLFDSDLYDSSSLVELRIIIETIKNKIFIDELKVDYLKLFFSSLRYVLSEQPFVDWIVKTSFVKAVHNVGELTQKVSYNNDNLPSFEEYINEVKPYRTKIREFISSYTKTDLASSSVTDFDLLPIIDINETTQPITVAVNNEGKIEASSSEITMYPWKHWYDNVKFSVNAIEIVDGGSGYISNPIIKIEGGFGTGASALAYTSGGKLTRIEITSAGTGYLRAPTVTIVGGLTNGGTPARAVAYIESETIRSNKISIKFDRITKTYAISELSETEEFVGTGSRLQFPLKWSPRKVIGGTSVTINDVEVLRDEYTLKTKTSIVNGQTRYSGLLTFNKSPAVGSNIKITYDKDFAHLSATDRINFYYNPVVGQIGKDLSQLMSGVDFGGVNITGLGFDIDEGWDSVPWFTDSWDSFDLTYTDFVVTVDDSTSIVDLPYTPDVDEEINVYLNGKRVDDPYYDVYDGSTIQPNGRISPPAGTYMKSFIGNGETNSIDISSLPLQTNSVVIFRKSTSDGSFKPTSEEYDTQLSGGEFNGTVLTSATGLAPDDIILDGDGLVTPITSHAPEEVIPGHVNDAVAIKVFTRPTGDSPKVIFRNYISDGSTLTFDIGQFFITTRSVIVKVDQHILNDAEYIINVKDNSITLVSAPAENSIISVISFGFNAEQMLDLGYLIYSGSSKEIITKAPWVDNISALVLINGNSVNYELFRTDETDEIYNCVGIRLIDNIEQGDLINYLVELREIQDDSTIYHTSTIVKSQQIIYDGSTQSYELSNLNSSILSVSNGPYETSVLVRNNDIILTPPSVVRHTLKNNTLKYYLPIYKFGPFSVSSTDIRVFLDGIALTSGVDYILDLSEISVTISSLVYNENSKLEMVVDSVSDYTINENGTITFKNLYPANTSFEIISFYNYTLFDISRTVDMLTSSGSLVLGTPDYYEFSGKVGKVFLLENPALTVDYVWVVKNGKLLTHSVDYILDDDKITIKLADNLAATDIIQIIVFKNSTISGSFGYMQFKDMLNRVHYKRLNKSKTTRLVRDLRQTDTVIYVADASVLNEPNISSNIPGVIEINGERIEYFIKNGNTLTQLRRATLGTGAPEIHRTGLLVVDLGISETIPYTDQTLVAASVSNGQSHIVSTNFIPAVATTNWFTDTIPVGYGKSNEIDVFVSGYRLKKSPYKLFRESNGYPYSPEGDSQYEAEFAVNGVDNHVYLTNIPAEDSKIIVTKKLGKLWNDFGEPLASSDNLVSNFVKNTETIWPQYLVDKYQYVLSVDQGWTLNTDDNNPLELD